MKATRPSGTGPEVPNQAQALPALHQIQQQQLAQGQIGPVASAMPQQHLPPQTPQSQNVTLPPQTPVYAPPSQASPPKPTPKSTLKALPTVRDHTTDQLGPGGDEYLPRETDEAGERKVQPNGQLNGGREYRCRTFLVPNRGDKLFMLATECARVLGYRDSYLLFNKNRSLYKIIANQVEKDHLVQQEILPFSYRSRQIAIVTARSMFRQFGSRVIVNGRRVRDDYWETKARKQGFTEADLAGEKRPGASKAREAAEAAAQQASGMLGGPHGEIIYSNTPAQFGGPPPTQLLQPDYNDTRRSDFSGILKQGPRQEITGPPYQDRTAPSPISEIHAQAHHAAEFNRNLNQQRDMRTNYLQSIWSRPHEQPATTSLAQPVTQVDSSVPTSRAAQSPHATTTSLQQPSLVPGQQSPQLMMTSTAPYSQPVHAQTQANQASMRGSSGTLPQASSSYNYTPQNQMWPPTPPTPQHGYSAYTAQPPSTSHHQQQQPGVPQLRHSSSSSSQVQPGSMPYSGLPGVGQSYGAPTQGLYSSDQTPRQYSMHQTASAAPSATQSWSQPQQAPAQWWTNQPQ